MIQKFTTMNFCYDYLNTTYFSSRKQEFDTDFVQTYSDAEQTSALKPKVYVPTLVLEEKILELEKLLKNAQSENESLRHKEQKMFELEKLLEEKTEINAEIVKLVKQASLYKMN